MQYRNTVKLFGQFYNHILPLLITLFIVNSLASIWPNPAVHIIASIAFFILIPLTTLALIDQASAFSNQTPKPFLQSLKHWSHPWSILRFYGLIFLLYIPAFVLAMLTGISLAAHIIPLAIVLGVLALIYVLSIIPTSVFSICNFVIEENTVIKAIKAGFKTAKGNYWYTFTSVFLYQIFSFLIMFIIGGSIATVIILSHDAKTLDAIKTLQPNIQVITSIITALFTTGFFIPFYQALIVKLYERAKNRAR